MGTLDQQFGSKKRTLFLVCGKDPFDVAWFVEVCAGSVEVRFKGQKEIRNGSRQIFQASSRFFLRKMVWKGTSSGMPKYHHSMVVGF